MQTIRFSSIILNLTNSFIRFKFLFQTEPYPLLQIISFSLNLFFSFSDSCFECSICTMTFALKVHQWKGHPLQRDVIDSIFISFSPSFSRKLPFNVPSLFLLSKTFLLYSLFLSNFLRFCSTCNSLLIYMCLRIYHFLYVCLKLDLSVSG